MGASDGRKRRRLEFQLPAETKKHLNPDILSDTSFSGWRATKLLKRTALPTFDGIFSLLIALKVPIRTKPAKFLVVGANYSGVKALSLKQPWAELMVQGKKTVELRNWKTKFRGDRKSTRLNSSHGYIS